MSNLLNNEKPKRKLLQRGPKIVPEQEFKLEPTDETPADVAVQEQPAATSQKTEPEASTKAPKTEQGASAKTSKAPAKAPKKGDAASITSVRVTKSTRNKLNALIQLGKADNVDTLIDILLDEYIETSLLKDEKKTFNLILDIIQKRDR